MSYTQSPDSPDLNSLKKDLSYDTIQKEAALEAGEKWQNRDNDLDFEQLTAPEIDLPSLEETERTISYGYATYATDYKIMKAIKEKGLTYALFVYQHKKCDQNLFNFLAGYINQKLDPILRKCNEKMGKEGKPYSHVSLYISTAHKTISVVIYDPDHYYVYHSDNPIIQRYLQVNANSKYKVKILDLSININEVKFSRSFQPLVKLEKEIKNKQQDQIVLQNKQKEIYDKMYDQVFNSPWSKIKSIFMKKSFREHLSELQNSSDEYKKIMLKYNYYEKELEQITQSLTEYSKKEDFYKSVKQNIYVINQQLLPLIMAGDEDLEKNNA